MTDTKKTKSASRMVLTIRSLLFMSLLGVGLTLWSGYLQHRDVSVAIGKESPQQEAFFVDAANRPDIATFFRKLPPYQRLAMAKSIGRYSDPQLAKLCGVLLGDFDAKARSAVAASLAKIAASHPDAVAAQLSQKGSFQFLGVAAALRSVGVSTLPFVVKEFDDPAATANAENLLVEFGTPSVPLLLPLLSSNNQSTRLATEDTLGKLRANDAVPKLTAIFESTKDPEREAALIALSSIADPRSLNLLAKILADASERLGTRSQAALGLGQMRTIGAANCLWKFATDSDSNLKDSVIDALTLCGNPALAVAHTPEDIRLTVASRLSGPDSDKVIREALNQSDLAVRAALAASDRPALVPDLNQLIANGKALQNGDLAEAAVGPLESTQPGRELAERLSANPQLTGFVKREEYLRLHG
jgi:HEAT repeat protein